MAWRRTDELSPEERETQRAEARAYYAKNRDRIRAYQRERYASIDEACPGGHAEARHAAYERRGAEYFRKRRVSHPDERRVANARYRAAHNDRTRDWYLRRHYGITLAEYERRLSDQCNLCALCGRPERGIHPRSRKVRRLAVDHCHDSGRVRGLLCLACNVAIGLFAHDRRLLLAAIAYLGGE